MSGRLTPKFLTPEVAERVVNMIIGGVLKHPLLDPIAKQERVGHIVILVPSVERDSSGWTSGSVEPHVLYQASVGVREWTGNYVHIAMNKAMQLWRDQNTDGNCENVPHLLFPSDTPYWGGVKRHGIVVAFSGDKPYVDQMISGMVADALKAFARFEWDQSTDKAEKNSFVT